jgi:hypothetical protein
MVTSRHRGRSAKNSSSIDIQLVEELAAYQFEVAGVGDHRAFAGMEE